MDILIVRNRTILSNTSICTIYGIITGTIIPIRTLCNRIPLRYCSHESNARKATAMRERSIAYARNSVRDYYALKATAIIERIITYARDAVTYSYARKAITGAPCSLAPPTKVAVEPSTETRAPILQSSST